ncbi:aldo/keto reductase [Loktanella sp. R86503]|uniref:aldo/keto reductase n=1 Tax=Loktanella sp. R86503 TaxID=3093847 RepID=UPI0036DD7994
MMKYKQLGHSGLYVSELTLGTMTFDNEGGSYADLVGATGQELATRMVDLAIAAGINILDTANVYSSGVSEKMLGVALGSRRPDNLIATKLYNSMTTGPNNLGTSRLAIMREVEGSLQRLGTDYIDLYQVHKPGVTSVIVGAREEAQLVDNLCAVDISLSDAEMARLNEVSAVKPEYPGYLPVWRRGDTLFSQLNT